MDKQPNIRPQDVRQMRQKINEQAAELERKVDRLIELVTGHEIDRRAQLEQERNEDR